MARLIVRGGDRKETYRLLEETVVIGRTKECTIPVDDVKSSRKHCEVYAKDGSYRVRDLESRNGTQLNGMPIQDEALRAGDVISIGKTTLTFELEDEPGAVAPGPSSATTEEKAPKLEILDLDDEPDTQVSKRRPLLDEEEDEPELARPVPSPPAELPAEVHQLMWQVEGGEEQVHVLGQDGATVGRSRKNTISLPDEASISSRHAKVHRVAGRWHVEDVGSTNGTKVNRKRIEGAVPLADGDRLQLGDVRFWFVRQKPEGAFPPERPPTVPFHAPARSSGRGGMGVVATSAVLVLALFGGILALHAHSSRAAGGAGQGAAATDGNLLADGSFEESSGPERLPAQWNASGGGIAIGGPGRTGAGALAFSAVPGPGARFHREAVTSAAVPVSPAKVYETSAWVRPERSSGVAGIEVTFLGKAADGAPPPLIGRHPCGLVGQPSADWIELRSRFQPPIGTESVRFHCFVAGETTQVAFDDCALVESPASGQTAPVPTIPIAGEDRFEVDVRGFGAVRAAGAREDRLAEIHFYAEEGGAVLFDQRYSILEPGFPKLESIEVGPGKTQAALVTRGRTFSFSTGTWIPFAARAYSVADLHGVAFEAVIEPGEVHFDPGAFLGVRAKLAHRFLASGTGVLRRVDSTTLFDAFQLESVEQLVWQSGTDQLGIYYPSPLVVGLAVGGEWAFLEQRAVLALSTRADGTSGVAVVLRTSFDRQEAEYKTLIQEVEDARRRGRPGRALVRLEEIQRKFPFRTRTDEVNGPYQRLRTDSEDAIAELRAGLDRAGFFRQASAYRTLVAKCEEIGASWKDHRAADEAGAIRDQAAAELAALDSTAAAQESALHLKRAEDCLALGLKSIGRAFLVVVTTRYPKTAAAERARVLLEEAR